MTIHPLGDGLRQRSYIYLNSFSLIIYYDYDPIRLLRTCEIRTPL